MRKPVVWLSGNIQSPPFSAEAKREVGYLLWQLQSGMILKMPKSRPMPSIGARCHELRVKDSRVTWRIVYRTDSEAVLVVEKFRKQTAATPGHVITLCKQRLQKFDSLKPRK